MKNKTNIAELLKDCPTGMELDCTMYDSVTLLNVNDREDITFPIKVLREDGNYIPLTKYGQYTYADFAKCVIYPKGKTTWEGFHRPFEDGDIVAFDAHHLQIFIFKDKKENSTLSDCYLMLDVEDDELFLEDGMYYVTRFATEEEKQKLFDAIKAKGYKWNTETKTLEKSTPKKFDITTLVPFDKVLMRSSNAREWVATFYSHYSNNKFYGCGMCCDQCIPYEKNEHLLGTTNDCDEFYKNW